MPGDERSSLPVRPLLIWALAVPCLIAGVSYTALGQLYDNSWELETLPIYLVFIAQIALLGYGVAWGIPHRVWRWIVFFWLLLLINLLLYAHGSLAQWRAQVLLRSLWAAQASAVIIWAVGGTAPAFYWRYPIAGLLALPFLWQIFTEAHYVPEEVSMRIILQWLFLALVLAALRWRGYVVERPEDAAAIGHPQATGELQTHQFGLRHLLVWMTSVSLVLAVAKGLGLFRLLAGARFGVGGLADVAITGGVLSCLMLIALWAALGEGNGWLRWLLCLVAPLGIGLALEGWKRWLYNVRPGRQWNLIWMIWAGLACGMLVALLMILRGEGYRLIRRSQVARPAQ